MADKHLSSQFDAELSHMSTRVLEMGGMVESQLRQVTHALHHFSTEHCEQVLELEQKVNRMEVEIDQEVTSIMSRRQPTARDLRLLVGVSRTIINLERAGDEASRIARVFREYLALGHRTLPTTELRVAIDMASGALHRSLDAFARLDVPAALAVIKDDDRIDAEYEGFLRKLITYMMEDPRTIGAGLNLLFLAKAIERVGDHAKNVAEAAIYVAKGADVRHTTSEQRERIVQ